MWPNRGWCDWRYRRASFQGLLHLDIRNSIVNRNPNSAAVCSTSQKGHGFFFYQTAILLTVTRTSPVGHVYSHSISTATLDLMLSGACCFNFSNLHMLQAKIANCSESGNVLALKTRPGRDSHRIRSTVYIPECPQRLSATQASIFLDTTLRINAFELVRVKGTCLFVSGVPA